MQYKFTYSQGNKTWSLSQHRARTTTQFQERPKLVFHHCTSVQVLVLAEYIRDFLCLIDKDDRIFLGIFVLKFQFQLNFQNKKKFNPLRGKDAF